MTESSKLDGGPLDSQGMFSAAYGLAEQVASAAEAARGLPGLKSKDEITSVLLLGMGGSGVAGDILQAIAGPVLAIPMAVSKGYTVPAWVGPSTLVFAVSFSGNTEETIEASTAAADAGAAIVAVTQGGRLGELAKSWGSPVVHVPTTIPQPRAGIGAVAIPPLIVLEEMGILAGASDWVKATVDQLLIRRDALNSKDNLAKQIARKIDRTVPLVYGGGLLGAVGASRWKNQINENAKSPAFWNTYPELCHNELAGWGQHGDLTRQIITLVELHHDHEHPQVTRRSSVVDEVLDEVVAKIIEVRAEGQGPLAQLFDLVLIGDCVSLELAAQEGIDPGPVPILNHVKETVAR